MTPMSTGSWPIKDFINGSNIEISSEGLIRTIINMLKNLIEDMGNRYEQIENFSKKLKLQKRTEWKF